MKKLVTLYLRLWKIRAFDMFPVAKKYRLCAILILLWFLLFYRIDHYRTWNERIHYLNRRILNNYYAEECMMM